MKFTDEQLIADARECVRIMRETNTFPTGQGVLSDIADRLDALTKPSGKVSDEQVERAVERWFLGEDVADCTDEMKLQWRDDMRAALEAALPHLSQGAVMVNPLEWKELTTGWVAHTSFHAYEVVKTDQGFMATYANRDFAWGAEDAMKAAAQADYERRILSDILTDPVGVAGVEKTSQHDHSSNR